MSDLISREAAIEAIEELVSTMSVCVSKEECKGMNWMKQRAILAIENLPTAEKVGKWIGSGDFDEYYRCSECRKGETQFGGLYRYCPNCGARMDGEEG